MKQKLQFSYYMRIVVSVTAYIIYFGFVTRNIILATDSGNRLFNVILLIFGLFAAVYEAMRICFDAATKRLILDDNPELTLKLLDYLAKVDVFKTYKTSSQMMRILALVDLRRFDEVKSFINSLNEEDLKNYDVDIVSKYGLMIAEGETNNPGKSNTAFKKLIALRDQKNTKGQRKTGAFFFDWVVVNGQHKNYDGDFESAYNHLLNVDESKMNKRELMQYLLAKLVACKNTNRDYSDIKQRLLKIVVTNKEMKSYIESM